MAKEARNILSQLCPDHIHLNQQVSKKERVKTKKKNTLLQDAEVSVKAGSRRFTTALAPITAVFSLFFLPACRLSCLGFAFLPMKFFYNWKKIATVYIYMYIFQYSSYCIVHIHVIQSFD